MTSETEQNRKTRIESAFTKADVALPTRDAFMDAMIAILGAYRGNRINRDMAAYEIANLYLRAVKKTGHEWAMNAKTMECLFNDSQEME